LLTVRLCHESTKNCCEDPDDQTTNESSVSNCVATELFLNLLVALWAPRGPEEGMTIPFESKGAAMRRTLPGTEHYDAVPLPGLIGSDTKAPVLAAASPAQSEIEWVTVPELAERIGIAKESAYRLARVGKLKGAVRMGRRYVVNYSAFVEASKAPITPAALRS
jgi:excisionase family DNA binding protein